MRLFVAVDLPSGVLQAVSAIREALASKTTGARWTPPRSMHLTLKFLGDVESERLEAVDGSLGSLQSPGFNVAVSGVGFFPNDRAPRVFWAGISSSGLEKLAGAVEQRMVALGFSSERRGFKPHLTLARSRGHGPIGRALVKAAGEFREQSFGAFTVSCFCLYESVLQPAGAVYTKLRTYPLEPGDTQ